jgi:hypothetical protein
LLIAVIWNHDTDDWMLGEDKTFQAGWIDANATQWANDAATSTEGGISLEHDLYQGTVDAAIRVLPILKKSYDVKPVGACSGMTSVYKEGGNVTASASSSAVAPSASNSNTQQSSSSSGAGSSAVAAGASSSQASAANKQIAGAALSGLIFLTAATLF